MAWYSKASRVLVKRIHTALYAIGPKVQFHRVPVNIGEIVFRLVRLIPSKNHEASLR